MLMHDVVAFTNISQDPYWCDQAEGLKENLKRFNIDLVINKIQKDAANDDDSLRDHYMHRVEGFLDFGRSETRRVFFLDAEVRMHQPLPVRWLDNVNVAFHVHGRTINLTGIDGKTYTLAINTGQGIWNKSGQMDFRRAFDQALDSLDKLGYYEEEAFIKDHLGDHLVEKLSLDRFSDVDCAAARGFWVNDHTILTHPYLHNIKFFFSNPNRLGINRITKEFFVAHFSPDDLTLARKIAKLLRSGKDLEKWSTNELPIEEITFPISARPPKFLPDQIKNSDANCYKIKDWFFCPQLLLTAPISEWDNNAYQIRD